MFKFSNLIDDVKHLKFDSVSQALASSQTLVSSFKSSVASIVSKAINQDALIKGQANGPDNFKVIIQDAIADLENIRDTYKVNLNTIRGLTVPAFVMSDDEAQSIIVNGDSGITISRGGIPLINCKLNLSPTDMNMVVEDFSLCQLPSDILFTPTMTAATQPSDDSAMFKPDCQGRGSVAASNSYLTATYTSYSSPIWISVRPLALGNTVPGANRWRDGLITNDPVSIGDGKVAYINICLVQSMQWVEHGNYHDFVPGIGLFFSLVIADADDESLSGDVVHKNASFFNYLPTLQGSAVRANNTFAYSMIRAEANAGLNILEHTYAGINASLDTLNPSPNLRRTFKFDMVQIARHVASQLTGYSESSAIIYQVPSSSAPQEVDAIDEFSFNQISIDTASVRTEDGYILTDISADISTIVGDLTTDMNHIIQDLDNGIYEN